MPKLRDNDEDRNLGPEMEAEKWIVIGGDELLWLHAPSRRAVNVREATWGSCRRIAHRESSTPSADADGYLVECSYRDELGWPIEGDVFWVGSYAIAVREARRIRQAILDETPATPPGVEQLSLPGTKVDA